MLAVCSLVDYNYQLKVEYIHCISWGFLLVGLPPTSDLYNSAKSFTCHLGVELGCHL